MALKPDQRGVLNVLRNERHCGDVLAHKTFTPDYCEHKSKKNRGDRTQYRWKDDHEAIRTYQYFNVPAIFQSSQSSRTKLYKRRCKCNTDFLPGRLMMKQPIISQIPQSKDDIFPRFIKIKHFKTNRGHIALG